MNSHKALLEKVKKSLIRLYTYCREENWTGYDPYDALNSPFFSHLSNKWTRIAATQILRCLPFNLRKLLKVKKGVNPKALALFIRSLTKLDRLVELESARDELKKISGYLLEMKSEDTSNSDTFSWGYNFPWQSRAFYCESFSPNIQSTIMGGHALYELSKCHLLSPELKQKYQDICIKASRYILNNLLMYEDEETAVLRYILNDNTVIINVQAQAAWSFLHSYLISRDERFVEVSEKLIRFVERKQHEDGSWPYSEASSGRFIDDFHTGFILEALHECKIIRRLSVTEESIGKGYGFYLNHFFQREGLASYFHNATYPVDSHSIAQSIITISKLFQYDDRSATILENIINWTLDNFQAKSGYFYYQKWPFFINKIPYMRWTQAWMFFALATFLDMKKEDKCAG